MERRVLLAAVGVSTPYFAGCTDWISDNPPELALGRIHVVNYSDQDTEIDVTVTKDSETAYQERHPISGYDESADQPRTGAVTIVEDWTGEPAEYEF